MNDSELRRPDWTEKKALNSQMVSLVSLEVLMRVKNLLRHVLLSDGH